MSENTKHTLNNEEIDCIYRVLNLGNLLTKGSELSDSKITVDTLKSTCQELLLRLHPDKCSAAYTDTEFNGEESLGHEFEKVLKTWKLLSKYSSEESSKFLLRQIAARHHQLKEEQVTNSVSKPLWKIITPKCFTLNGKILKFIFNSQ